MRYYSYRKRIRYENILFLFPKELVFWTQDDFPNFLEWFVSNIKYQNTTIQQFSFKIFYFYIVNCVFKRFLGENINLLKVFLCSGVSTGSVYKDVALLRNGFPAESVNNGSVIAVKTHEWGQEVRGRFQAALLLLRWDDGCDVADISISYLQRSIWQHPGGVQ